MIKKTKLKTVALITLAFALVFITSVFIVRNFFFKTSESSPEVCFEKTCYQVEIADSKPERSLGLMYRTHLDQNRGMFFVFDRADKHGFWMKNTKIPLDIIWLNNENIIIDYKSNAVPCQKDECPIHRPSEKALYVLEVNAGQIQEKNLQIGDKAQISPDLQKSLE